MPGAAALRSDSSLEARVLNAPQDLAPSGSGGRGRVQFRGHCRAGAALAWRPTSSHLHASIETLPAVEEVVGAAFGAVAAGFFAIVFFGPISVNFEEKLF